MLRIRKEQIQAFEIAALHNFENEMVEHSRNFTPKLCEVLGEEKLRIAIKHAMSRASEYGFTNRGPIRLYIEMTYLFGSDFDTDPQYPIFNLILNEDNDQMVRAEKLHNEITTYLADIAGPNAENVFSALESVASFSRKPMNLSSERFHNEIKQELVMAFPKKTEYVGDDGLNKLIDNGRKLAKKYEFPEIRGDTLLIILMFAFGHGCTNDPLYPWIRNTLIDKRIQDSVSRAARLEKKALTWLDHVLSAPRNEARL
ncbi:MAG: hypothetical protein OEZ39_08105 [Gammaproteobacteria bacterium]|nr:hypothetical protein [Gammaproteobacteria bacterium]MDH5651824.1 hypothetical protein [Gammaproteobacteria bacterium]